MEFSQTVRHTGASLRRFGARQWERLSTTDPEKLKRWAARSVLLLSTLVVFYYVIGMIWVNRIDDNLNFAVNVDQVDPGQSHAVAITAALLEREIKDHDWVANDPFFLPSSLLDNMPNYQMGIVSSLARFGFELLDHLGRTRGSSQADPDLQDAAGSLQYSGTRWIWEPSVSIIPTAPAEDHYAKARKALLSYNGRLAKGTAVFDRRSDNLLATLDRIASDLGSSSATIENILARSGNVIDAHADDEFYKIKGQLYGYYMILYGLQQDFEPVIAEKKIGPLYAEMLKSFARGAGLDPFAIMNMKPDGLFFPNHLAAQGFYLLRARAQLREITDALLK